MTDPILDRSLSSRPSSPLHSTLGTRFHTPNLPRKHNIINTYLEGFFWHAVGNEHMHPANVCGYFFYPATHAKLCMRAHIWARCVCVCVWDWKAEAKVKSALARLSGWMENIRISRDCLGICRWMWLALAAYLCNTWSTLSTNYKATGQISQHLCSNVCLCACACMRAL